MKETKLSKVDALHPDPSLIEEAAEVLRNGGLVAFPTETVYGLGADALNLDAVKDVFKVKGRPGDNPMIIHVSSQKHLFELFDEMPEKGEILSQAFWPGPLTLVSKRTILVSDLVTGGLDTVAVRMPDHPVALGLIEELGSGIVGPSANLSGRPSPTFASHVLDDLKGKVDIILDAGLCKYGLESTVIDLTVDPPTILRPGAITKEELESVIGTVSIDRDSEMLKRSPGTRYRHYAPHAEIVLIERENREQIEYEIQRSRQEGKTVGCIVHTPLLRNVEVSEYFHALPPGLEMMARQLYRILREMDQKGVDIILVEEVEEVGLGATIMDRLKKAARK